MIQRIFSLRPEIVGAIVFRCTASLRTAALLLFFATSAAHVYAAPTLTPTVTPQPSRSIIVPQAPAQTASALGGGALSDLSHEGTVISSSNLDRYRSLVIPELAPFIRAGLAQVRAYQQLAFDVVPPQSASELGPVDLNSTLTDPSRVGKGFAFGTRAMIQRELDPRKAGQKVLWNVSSALWDSALLRTEFTLSSIKEGQPIRQIQGSILRVYPANLSQSIAHGQLFREKVSFSAPPIIKDMAWLSFRFLGNEEDYVWIYSPALKKVRQLTGSNRSDEVLKAVVSTDDLFGWSGKVEAVNPKLSGVVTALAPIAGLQAASLESRASGCVGVVLHQAADNGKGESAIRQGSNQRSSNPWQMLGAEGAASDVVFVPRKMWRVELSPLDPFSRYGRQVLYVDTELMVPLYKFVYDHMGHLWKVVLSPFGVAQREGAPKEGGGGVEQKVYQSFLMVDDLLRNEFAVLDFSRIEYCKALPADVQLSALEPHRLAGVLQPAPESSPQKSKRKEKK